MKRSITLLIFFLLSGLQAQEIISFDWGADVSQFSNSSNRIIVPLDEWQIEYSRSGVNKIQVPFAIPGIKRLVARTQIALQNIAPDKTLYFVTQGIKGSVSLFVNNHLISFLGNGEYPLKLAIPRKIVREDSVLKIELKIRQPQSASEGFPEIVYTYSEDRALGIPRPAYLIIETAPVIEKFRHKLVNTESGWKLVYSYLIKTDKIYKRIQIKELFSRESDGRIVYRKNRYTKDISGNQIKFKGEFPVSANLLWSVDSPRRLRFTINAEFSGQEKTALQKEVKFGVRDFRFSRNKFYLNNEQIQIRGINYRQNIRSLNNKNYFKQLKNDFSAIKQLGCNTVRLTHFLPDERLLEVADSLGLLIFAEIPIWRFPAQFFSENYLLELGKKLCTRVAPFYAKHPSLVAIGLGQEIPLHDPAVQKFMFIINSKMKSQLKVLTYISPIPDYPLPPEKAADFYLYDRYQPLSSLPANTDLKRYSLIGKLGILTSDLVEKENSEPQHQLNRGFHLKYEINKALNILKTQGGFIESYRDWYSPFPTVLSYAEQPPYLIPQGLFRVDGVPKPWAKLLENPWIVEETSLSQNQPLPDRPSNFFSILITFSAIIFFGLYRKMIRLRENFRRAIRHSYGFFVDLRERRIIPLMNSITVGIFISLILASFIGSQIYFYHDSYWLQEVMAIFLIPLNIFDNYLKISKSYFILTLTLFLIFFALPVISAIIIKLFAWLNKTKIRFRQGLAVMFWSGAPLVWFFPISLISYHWLFYQQNGKWLWIILGIFFLWIHLRMLNGLHILFITKTSKIFMILLLCYSVPLLIFWAIFNTPVYWLDYLNLLMEAQSLF